jgi:hypothetical protein
MALPRNRNDDRAEPDRKPNDPGEPEIGDRIPFIWSILAAAAVWGLVGALGYGIYLLAS